MPKIETAHYQGKTPHPLTHPTQDAHNGRALEKDSAGRGNPLLHNGASRYQSGFILRVSCYGRDLREPFGVAGFPLCTGFPPRKLLPAQPWKAGRQAFKLHNGGNHA